MEGGSKEFLDAAKNHFAVVVGGDASQKNSQTLRKTRLTVGGKMQ